jgi:hypothetical protein
MSRHTNRRLSKPKPDPTVLLALSIVPAAQVANGSFREVNVANHTDADQRHAVRSKETRTVRRLSRVELMAKSGVITSDQALACGWYAFCYEMGYQTVGCTANYSGAGGGGFGVGDLLARYKAQSDARENYLYAKQSIPNHLLGLFEGIVLGTGRPPHMMPKEEKTRFSLAAFLLHGQISHLLEIAA